MAKQKQQGQNPIKSKSLSEFCQDCLSNKSTYKNNKSSNKENYTNEKPQLKIPKDTREILSSQTNIDNFYLKLSKFAIFNNDNKAEISKQGIKEDFFKGKQWDFYKENIESYYKSIEALVPEKKEIELKTLYRLVVGSEESVYETSLRLHHIYGVPFIPASAIKGVIRSYIIDKCFESKEETALNDDDFRKVFGSDENSGNIIFFDAFPITAPTIKMDIMNVHYKDYYNDKKGKKPPIESKTNPIKFLTVEDTAFKFIVASKDSVDNFQIKDKNILYWLIEALTEHGVGRKTSVGYGYFEKGKSCQIQPDTYFQREN